MASISVQHADAGSQSRLLLWCRIVGPRSSCTANLLCANSDLTFEPDIHKLGTLGLPQQRLYDAVLQSTCRPTRCLVETTAQAVCWCLVAVIMTSQDVQRWKRVRFSGPALTKTGHAQYEVPTGSCSRHCDSSPPSHDSERGPAAEGQQALWQCTDSRRGLCESMPSHLSSLCDGPEMCLLGRGPTGATNWCRGLAIVVLPGSATGPNERSHLFLPRAGFGMLETRLRNLLGAWESGCVGAG